MSDAAAVTRHYGSAGMERETREPRGCTRRNAEEIYKYSFTGEGIVVRENSDGTPRR